MLSLLLVAPPYLFMLFWSLTHSLLSDRLRHRFWFFIYPIPIAVTGFVIFMTTHSFAPRYFAVFLMIFVVAPQGSNHAWLASAMPRPPAKRAVAFAFVNSCGAVASVWTPFLYPLGQAPFYRVALGVNVALLAVAVACGVVLRVVLERQNRELERAEVVERVGESGDGEGKEGGGGGVVEGTQKGFRYMI